MNTIIAITLIQALNYLIWSFLLWDWTWFLRLGEESFLVRLSVVLWWLLVTLMGVLIAIAYAEYEGELGDLFEIEEEE